MTAPWEEPKANQVAPPTQSAQMPQGAPPVQQAAPTMRTQPSQRPPWQTPPDDQGANWLSPFTGSGITPEPANREFSGDYLPGLGGLGYELQSMMSFSPESKAAMARKIPGSVMSEDSQGNPIITFPKGSTGAFKSATPGQRMYLDKPGFSQRNFTDLAGTAAAFTPAGIAFNAMKGAGLAARAFASGGISGATELARQAGLNILGDLSRSKNMMPGYSMPELGMSIAFQAMPDYLMGRMTRGTMPPGVPVGTGQKIDERATAAANQEIPLARGQLSNVPADVEDLRTLQQVPETSMPAQDFLERQNENAKAAAGRFVDNISEDTGEQLPIDIAQERAQGAIYQAYKAMSESSLYKEALSPDLPPVATDEVRHNIKTMMSNYAEKTPMHNVLKRIRGWMEGDKIPQYNDEGIVIGVDPAEELTLPQIHNVGSELLGMEQTARAAGQRAKAMWLNKTRGQVLDYIEAVSPEYKNARNLWRELSKPIDDLEKGIVGKLATMKPEHIDAVMKRAFNPDGIYPKRARANIQAVLGDDMLAQLKQQHAQSLMDRIQTTGVAEIQNWPNFINRALFKTKNMRDMWKEGATVSQQDAVDELYTALNAAASGRAVGSPTATRLEAMAKLTSKLPESIKRIALSAITHMPVGMADKGLASISARRTQAIREKALENQIGKGVGVMRDELLWKYQRSPGYTSPKVGATLQGIRGQLQ